jgi:hypothetical protein
MISFRLCYDLNKHTSDRDSILGLHPALWVIVAIGPLTQVNIYGIITIVSIQYHLSFSV